MARERSLKAGKLPPRLMAALLGRIRSSDPTLKIGPALGEDTAAIALGDQYLISKTDPITLAESGAAELLIQVNANDLATRGCAPRYLQVTALLPVGTTTVQIKRLFQELRREARRRGVTITGGHTEITDAVTRPVLAGAMLGMVPRDRLISSAGAKPGDRIVMAGAAGLEGTIILASKHREKIVAELGLRAYREALVLRKRPGTSVTDAGIVAAKAGVHAMHDPTEGGVAAALYEMAYGARLRASVDLERIPIYAITRSICSIFRIDPLGLIASGALLIAVAPVRLVGLLSALRRSAISAVEIGYFEKGRGVKAKRCGRSVHLQWFERDELLKALERGKG